MSAWKTVSSTVTHENPWYKVRVDQVITHQGKALTYNVTELHHPSVFVVAMNSDGHILLQKNYRYTIDQTIWELPAGHSDGQAPLEAAARELQEEDGLQSDEWQLLGRMYQATGTSNMPIDVCLAQNVRSSGVAANEDGELIEERRFFSPAGIDTMVRNGDLINASDIGAIHMAMLHIKEKK